MAWQNPKTNWSAEDGVRDSDLNRIEGNILELHNDNAHADIVVYVSTNGNDTTGDGSAAAPYRTIGKALSVIPRNLNGKDVILSITGGYYPESVAIKGFDAPISIVTSGDTVSVNGLRIDGCKCSFNGASITSNGPTYITNCATLTGVGTLRVFGSTLVVNYGSKLSLDSVSCNEAFEYAVSVDGASMFYAKALSGVDNTNGISCQGGSILAYGTSTLAASRLASFTASGGRIYSGAQSISQLP